jgi:hypothetical protein
LWYSFNTPPWPASTTIILFFIFLYFRFVCWIASCIVLFVWSELTIPLNNYLTSSSIERVYLLLIPWTIFVVFVVFLFCLWTLDPLKKQATCSD